MRRAGGWARKKMYAFTKQAATAAATAPAPATTPYPPIIILLGLSGMIFSLVGNIMEKQEMYPLFLERRTQLPAHPWARVAYALPSSMFFSCISDVLVGVYGLLIGDPIVVVYGVVNTVVIVCTVVELYTEHALMHEKSIYV